MRFATALAVLAVCSVAAPSDDPFAGTWKMDLEKSSNNVGVPLPKSFIRTYTPGPNGTLTVEATVITSEGKDYKINGVVGDDKDTPTTSDTGGPFYKFLSMDTSRSTRKGPRELRSVFLKDGKQIGTSTSQMSEDGQTITQTMTGTRTDGGGRLEMTAIWIKQPHVRQAPE